MAKKKTATPLPVKQTDDDNDRVALFQNCMTEEMFVAMLSECLQQWSEEEEGLEEVGERILGMIMDSNMLIFDRCRAINLFQKAQRMAEDPANKHETLEMKASFITSLIVAAYL